MGQASSKILMDGSKNAVVVASGELSSLTILKLADLKDIPRQVKIDQLLYAFQGNNGAYLYWKGKRGGEEFETVFLPIEGRGLLDFERLQSLPSPEGTEEIYLSVAESDGSNSPFLLMFDLSKQP